MTFVLELFIASGGYKRPQTRIKSIFLWIGLLGLGLISGLMSLAILPRSAVHNSGYRIVFLAFMTLSGGLFASCSAYFMKKGATQNLKAPFFQGMIFVFGVGLVRLLKAD
jgi:hypothetical protein